MTTEKPTNPFHYLPIAPVYITRGTSPKLRCFVYQGKDKQKHFFVDGKREIPVTWDETDCQLYGECVLEEIEPLYLYGSIDSSKKEDSILAFSASGKIFKLHYRKTPDPSEQLRLWIDSLLHLRWGGQKILYKGKHFSIKLEELTFEEALKMISFQSFLQLLREKVLNKRVQQLTDSETVKFLTQFVNELSNMLNMFEIYLYLQRSFDFRYELSFLLSIIQCIMFEEKSMFQGFFIGALLGKVYKQEKKLDTTVVDIDLAILRLLFDASNKMNATWFGFLIPSHITKLSEVEETSILNELYEIFTQYHMWALTYSVNKYRNKTIISKEKVPELENDQETDNPVEYITMKEPIDPSWLQ